MELIYDPALNYRGGAVNTLRWQFVRGALEINLTHSDITKKRTKAMAVAEALTGISSIFAMQLLKVL